MARALENLCIAPTYLEFFGFTRPPFARLSRPSEVFHTEQHSLLLGHLAHATERSDRLVVICGADGSGKTTLLNRYIASLSDDISFATIDETCSDATQFYCTFLRQLGFGDITGTLNELRRITKEYLVHRGIAGDVVLVMLDNAHLISAKVLEQLRWVSSTKVKDRRVLSVVLAGNSDLVRIMDSPAMSQIDFRSHVDFNIRAYTGQETANYVRHRLMLAGGINAVTFLNEAYPLIHRYTGGIPGLINMLCNAIFTEAYTLESRVITEHLVRAVADDRRLLPHVVPLRGKGRRNTDPEFKLVQREPRTGERITVRDSKTQGADEKPTARPKTPGVGVKHLTDEIDRMNEALSDSAIALQISEKAARKLASDLEKTRSVAKTAQSEIAEMATEMFTLRGELDTQNEALGGLENLFEKSRNECQSLRSRAAALENLKESKTKKDVRIADLQDELLSSSQEIMALSTRNEELESRDMELTEADADIAALASELQEATQNLVENQVQLAEYSTLILQLKTENELASSTLASMTMSASELSDAVVTSLEIVKDGVVERVVEIAESPSRFMIGRGDDSELLLDSKFVSRHHAMISCTEQRIYIEDLNSSNGTVVNLERITRCELRPGDIVMIGDYEIWTRQGIPGK